MINKVQQLNFELMKEASFNFFNGWQVTKDLEDHKDLWRGAIMTRMNDLITLRDIENSSYNVDTLFILASETNKDKLELLAKTWNADEVDWIEGGEACNLLGSWSKELGEKRKVILRIWWD